MKLTFVMGATASGKSHFIRQHYTDKDVELLDIYDYQTRAYDEAKIGNGIPLGMQFKCLMCANNELLEDVKARLSQGRDIVVEHTLFKAKRRIAYIDEIRKQFDVTIEFYVMCPGDDLWKSNLEKRDLRGDLQGYKDRAADIEFPNTAEGIDAIYEVADGEIRLRMDPPTPEILEPAREELREEAERIRKEEEAGKKRRELLESMKERKFWHYCEVCGKKEFMTAKEAFDDGWDYPPHMGHFGMLGPRTCGNCLLKDTLFWKINTGGGLPIVCEGELSPREVAVWRRIKGEPESLLEEQF